VIFEVNMLPGNLRYQAYPSGTKAAAFTVGSDDGYAAREVIAAMPAGQAARVAVTFEMRRVSDLKSALVWGTLPGATDETVYLIAHRDGWFDAAGDNASGVASIVALAQYYAKVPLAKSVSPISISSSSEPTFAGSICDGISILTLFPRIAGRCLWRRSCD
jgi:hypothetical protein